MPIYLVRHGEAESTGSVGDAGRPLTAAGRDKLTATVTALRPQLTVTKVLASPFVRTRQTAELIATMLGVPHDVDSALSSGSFDGVELLRHVLAQPDGTMLVGHNPEVAGALMCAGLHHGSVQPGTIAAISVKEGVPTVLWSKV